MIILHKRLNLIDWHTLELKSSLKLSTKMVLNLKDMARFSLQKASIRKTRIRTPTTGIKFMTRIVRVGLFIMITFCSTMPSASYTLFRFL